MLVSVLISTFNRADQVMKAIQSVLDQTYQDFEIIVSDDGSSDNTKEVVRGFNDDRVKYFYQENRGVASARNLGLRNANGEVIAFLDDDDWWLPEHLELIIDFFSVYPEASMVYTQNEVYFADGSRRGPVKYKRKEYPYIERKEGYWLWTDPFEIYLDGHASATPCVAVKREVFEEIGGFYEAVTSGQDYDMHLRIVNRFKVGVIKKPTVCILCQAEGISETVEPGRYAKNLRLIWNHILEECELTDEQRFRIERKIDERLD